MIVLALKTDQPRAYLGVFKDYNVLAQKTWQAHRELSATFYDTLSDLLKETKLQLKDINGIVCFEGPGSFTGLRIGLSAANALAYALESRIVESGGPEWIHSGIDKLLHGKNTKVVLPLYGSEAHITAHKK